MWEIGRVCQKILFRLNCFCHKEITKLQNITVSMSVGAYSCYNKIYNCVISNNLVFPQDFDTCVMTKMYGYSTPEEMYQDWSCARYVRV